MWTFHCSFGWCRLQFLYNSSYDQWCNLGISDQERQTVIPEAKWMIICLIWYFNKQLRQYNLGLWGYSDWKVFLLSPLLFSCDYCQPQHTKNVCQRSFVNTLPLLCTSKSFGWYSYVPLTKSRLTMVSSSAPKRLSVYWFSFTILTF